MTAAVLPATPKRDWLWKHELAEIFAISRQTLRKWLIRLQTRHELLHYNPMCRKLNSSQIRQLCDLLGFSYSECMQKMVQH